jgi:hypothetical protein
MTILHDALNALKPNAIWSITGDDTYANITWIDTEQTKPTESAVTTKVNELQAAYDAQAYARKRKVKYDALNQFELISDDAINGTTTHKDAIVAIKSEFPKP